MKESLGLYACHFGVDFSFLAHKLFYYRVLLLEKSSEGLRGAHVENDLFIVGCASLLQLDYLFFQSLDFFAKLINTIGIFWFIFVFFVRLLARREGMAMVFDDSIGLHILFIEFFLEVDIFVAILLIFVDNFLGVVKIIFKFFIFVF